MEEHYCDLNYMDDNVEGNEDELFSIIHRIDSNEILYSQPEIKYKLIGPYIKGDLLGEGSYGKVKECVHSRTLERCAVKIMSQRNLKRITNGEENVKREIQVLKGLNHKNVIRLKEVMYFPEKHKIYMVMEYCVTGLQEMLDRAPNKKFPSWQAHRYFVHLVNGLEYLHGRGVIHKDIKPGNLLLSTNSTLKIIDFGVAEQLDYLATDDYITTSQGSPVFQPPEVAKGVEKFHGFKVDVWSAGVTLYNITSGSYPFDGENVFRLYESISENPVVIPAELDESLRHLLTGMLMKDPEERFHLQTVKKHKWFLTLQPPIDGTEVPLLSKKSPRYLPVDAVKMEFYRSDEDSLYQQQFITEHDLNESRNKEDERSWEETPKTIARTKKRKAISCISLRGLASCSQS